MKKIKLEETEDCYEKILEIFADSATYFSLVCNEITFEMVFKSQQKYHELQDFDRDKLQVLAWCAEKEFPFFWALQAHIKAYAYSHYWPGIELADSKLYFVVFECNRESVSRFVAAMTEGFLSEGLEGLSFFSADMSLQMACICHERRAYILNADVAEKVNLVSPDDLLVDYEVKEDSMLRRVPVLNILDQPIKE